MVLPCPVSWVPEVRPSSGEGAPEKRSPGPLFPQAGKRSSQEVTQASLLQGTTGLSVPGRSGCQSVCTLSIAISPSFLKLMSIKSVMPSNHLILCCPLLLLPSVFLSIRIFSSESALHIMWPNCWSFNFSINPSNKCSGFICFSIDWFDLLAVQGTLKSLLQHHRSKTSILHC